MSPSALAQLFQDNPTQPYRLRMSSGDEIIVDNPSRVLITELEAYIRQSNDPDALVGNRVRMVSIPNINIVEPISRTSQSFRRRRTK